MNKQGTAAPIVWLHLSDLHLCPAKTGHDAHRVLDTLLDDLKDMAQKHGLIPQLIFFTGDAAYGNLGTGPGQSLAEQYAEVETFLTRVRQVYKPELPKENLFIVPGNHDVDRKIAEAMPALASYLDKDADAAKVNEMIQTAGPQWRQFMERLLAYRQFLQDYGYTHLLPDPERLIHAQLREINGVKIGIGGFNSAWSSWRDGEKGKLWLGGDWQNGEIVSQFKKFKPDLKLALIHHPSGWLVAQEVKFHGQMERDFHFLLHGHEHQGWVNRINHGHLRIAGAAGYQGSAHENGYNLVRWHPGSGDCEIWLRRYDDDGGGWVPRVVKGKTNNDGLWSIPVFFSLKGNFEIPGHKNTKPALLTVNGEFFSKVRDELQRILSDKSSAATLLSQCLKKESSKANAVDALLELQECNIDHNQKIRFWRKIVESSLTQRPEIRVATKDCANQVLGWLVLLVVNENELKNHVEKKFELGTATKIIVPVKTPAGIGIFFARLMETPAQLQLKNKNDVFCSGFITTEEIETGFLSADRLEQIEKAIYLEVLKHEPKGEYQDWLAQLKYTLELRYEDDKEVYYFNIPHIDLADGFQAIEQLKRDLPHLNAIITGRDNNNTNSILVMDENLLVPLLREYLLMLEKFS